MRFFEKLDFLMKLTNTSNSALALQVKLDASHISRLRRGERNALRNEDAVKSMATYFAKHCEQEYQHKAIEDALNISKFPDDESKLSSSIAKWLLDNRKEKDTVEFFLSGFANAKTNRATPTPCSSYTRSESKKCDVSVYYGIEGKRQAAIDFLQEVLSKDKPVTLLLHSEEPTDWLVEDPQFAKQWGDLMLQLIAKGGKFKIIHSLNRDLDEMLKAISQWLPLYMYGSIEPYYYPKKKDGVYKRTLFIAQNTVAVVSSSVGNMNDQAANVLFRDRKAVAAFEKEYNEYLSLCKPLMRVFALKDQPSYLDTLLNFEREPSNVIIKTESLSLLTMPEKLADSVISRVTGIDRDFLEYHKKRKALFEQNIRSYTFTEIVQLFDAETVREGKVTVAFSHVLNGVTIYYTKEEYIMHLEHIVQLLETYDNFYLCFYDGNKEEQLMVYAKEDVGALAAKTSEPPLTLAFSENNIRAAFWDYLLSIINCRNKDSSIKKLNEYIEQLKNG